MYRRASSTTASSAPSPGLTAQETVKATFVYGTHVNVPEYVVVGSSTYRIVTDYLGSPRLGPFSGTVSAGVAATPSRKGGRMAGAMEEQ